jgi:hypothetical protein
MRGDDDHIESVVPYVDRTTARLHVIFHSFDPKLLAIDKSITAWSKNVVTLPLRVDKVHHLLSQLWRMGICSRL